MAPKGGAALRRSALWSPEQSVHASELAGTRRVPLGSPADVPDLRALRTEDRDWRPADYRRLPTRPCSSPGYTLLENVFLTAPGLVLAGDGRFVTEDVTRLTPTHLPPLFERALGAGPAARAAEWPAVSSTIEEGILLAGAGGEQYGHWLIDFLPPLAILDRLETLPDWPLLMSEGCPPWMDAMVRLFGSRRRKIVRFPRQMTVKIAVGRLCVPWVLRQPAFHPAAGEVFDRLVRAHAPTSSRASASPLRRIYVERPRSGAKRPLTNAEDARAFFVDRGFEPVRPELLPFTDQIRLFAGAEAVAGEAGSGLHGTVFSKPGISTIELRPPSYKGPGQPAIAVLKRQGLLSVKGAHLSTPAASHDPWTLDLDHLERRLSAYGPL